MGECDYYECLHLLKKIFDSEAFTRIFRSQMNLTSEKKTAQWRPLTGVNGFWAKWPGDPTIGLLGSKFQNFCTLGCSGAKAINFEKNNRNCVFVTSLAGPCRGDR